MKRSRIILLCAIIAVGLVFWGCSTNEPLSPVQSQNYAPLSKVPAHANASALENAIRVQDMHTAKLMEKTGVVGTASGLDENGEAVIMVFVKEAGNAQGIPEILDNVKVSVDVTGEIRAYGKPAPAPAPAPTVDHKARQAAPIKLGTSGGWTSDFANGYCCGGTLGALITDGTDQYILSNYHVFQADILAGGNNKIAQAGDFIIQPGLIDAGCNSVNAQPVAALSAFSFPASLPASNVDASIAEAITGMVDATGAILEIGTLSNQTIPYGSALVGVKVKKSGRTSGLTRSAITGINGTVNITYDTECAGVTAFTKTFTGQIIISNLSGITKGKGNSFLRSGDSGSLMVEDLTTKPKAIGLLYAGSNSVAIANPINEVLSHFGAASGSTFTMVGN